MAVIQNLIAKFTADSTAFEKGTNRARKSLYGIQQESLKTQKSLANIAKGAASFLGIGVGIYGVQRIMRSAVTEAANFERQIAKVSTMLDEQTMRYLPQYEKEIKKLSFQFGEAKENLTQGLYDILSAQITPSRAIKVLTQSLKSAKGGFTNTATVVKATTQIMKAYGEQVYSVDRIQDILHATVRQGRFDFEALAGNMGDIIGLAAYLNIDLEAVGASLATMSRAGLDADKSVTALKNILNQFINPSAAARQAAEQLGFKLDDTSIKGDGLIKIMKALSKANAEQLTTLMPSIRGLVGFASQLKNNQALAEDYLKISESTGLAEENLNKAMDNHAAKIDQLTQRWTNFKVVIGDAAFALSDIPKKMRDITGGGEEMDWGQAAGGWGNAMKKAYAGLGVDIGTKNPSHSQYYLDEMAKIEEVNKQRADLISGLNQMMQTAGTDGGDMLADARVNNERARDQLVEANKVLDERRKSYMKLYEDIGDYGEEYMRLVERQLDSEVRKYSETVKDEVLLADWKTAKLAEIAEKISKKQEEENQKIKSATEMWVEMYSGKNVWDRLSEDYARGLDDMGMKLTDWMKTGEMDWRSWCDSLLTSWMDTLNKMAVAEMQQNIIKPVAGALSAGISGFVSNLFSPSVNPNIAAAGPNPNTLKTPAGGWHGGGIVGADQPSFTRAVPAVSFAAAPRLHSGTNEYNAILKKDEGVFTPAQMEKLAPAGGSVKVEININNQSSRPLEAKQGASRYEGGRYITELIVSDLIQGGPISRALPKR